MKTIKRTLCLLLVLVTVVSMMPIQADALSPTYTVSGTYDDGEWYRNLKNVELTGNQRADIVAVARSQVGYTEGSSDNQLSGYAKTNGNHTEYGKWYGLQDMWCSMFVSWCANQARVSTGVVPSTSYTVTGLNTFINWGRAYTRAQVANGQYTPQPGDIIYFKGSRNTAKTNHVGIVTGYASGTVYTIEGNTNNAADKSTNGGGVFEKSYSISDTYIVYICCPNYANSNQVVTTTQSCFPRYTGSSGSLVTGLNAVGANSSYAYRKQIAAANGISGYSGTAAQNTQLLNWLKAGTLKKPGTTTTVEVSKTEYFPRCAASHTSIVNALKSVGADSSYDYRKQVAAANGISGYSGTAAQNTQLLSLLKAGALKKPGGSSAPTVSCFPRYTGSSGSLVTGLNAVGADSSYAYRKQIAAANGISGYSGTAAQNTQLLNWLKAGTLKKP